MTSPPRAAWSDFPDAALLADERATRRHPAYLAAKAGDAKAARLVEEPVGDAGIAAVRAMIDSTGVETPPVLVSAHAYEREGFNASRRRWRGA